MISPNKLVEEWWRWSVDIASRPVPHGYVFLGSGPASTGHHEDSVTLKQGNYIFGPVINWISLGKRPSLLLYRTARKEIQDTIATHQSSVPSQYIESDFFKLNGQTAISAGFWINEKLPIGKHVITSAASCKNGTISLSHTHKIEVI